MICAFSIELSGAEDLYPLARRAILSAGGSVSGDRHRGGASIPTAVGDVALAYELLAGTLHVQVLEKPMLLSCDRIEYELRAAIADATRPTAPPPPTPAEVVIDVAPDVADAPTAVDAARALAEYLSHPDANFGSAGAPSEPVRDFQTAVGITADGILGSETRAVAAALGVSLPYRRGEAVAVPARPPGDAGVLWGVVGLLAIIGAVMLVTPTPRSRR